jgi:predicted dinucleotide-binding enzyme
MKVGILGYGSVGKKLAKLFSEAGHEVFIGLRDQQEQVPSPYRRGTFVEVAREVDILALAIPYKASLDILKELASYLANKIVIDNTNPLNDDWSPLLLGQENSAGEEIQRELPQAYVVKAFNTIFADVMHKEAHDRAGHKITAFIAGNDTQAKQTVLQLASACGFHALDVGDISSSRYLEAMAHLNIRIAVGLNGGTQAAFLYHQVKS